MAAPAAPEEDPFAHTRMTLGEHLDELRKRLVRGLLAVSVAFVGALVFHEQLTKVILEPHVQCIGWLNADYRADAEAIVAEHPELRERYFAPDGTLRLAVDERLVALTPTESMWFVLKVAGYAALFIGSPFLLWQLWQFVAAGLYPRERKWTGYFFPPALVLFVSGVVFAYLVLVPYGMYYALRSTSIELVKPNVGLGFYFSFLTTLCLGMGLVFQLPILMTFVARVGMVPAASFARLRGHFVIVAAVLAAVLTPGGDIFSMVAMGVPMLLLYELGILGARWAARSAPA
jgi:sec-independent protein translocase protein TatC